MTGLAVKDVQFNGTTLRAAQDTENIIWVGVRWVCQGLGLSKGQMQNERKKIQMDEVLSQGERNFVLPTDGGNQETLCLKLDFLPLWLAKIRVTPKMSRENPELASKLFTYQLRAKDVLAAAFIKKEEIIPASQIQELKNTIDTMYQEQQKMYKDISKLANIIIDMKESGKFALPEHPEQNAIPDIETRSSWKADVYDKIDHICDSTTELDTRRDVLIWIYRYMNKNYGIVWDQEEREYKERNSIHTRPSTIDIIHDKSILKSIFNSVLADLEYKYCHKSEDEIIDESDRTNAHVGWADQVIAPLVAKYGDRSNAGMATYRRVYKKMEEDSKIGWKNLTTRYINQYGGKPLRKNLIETRPSLRNKFRQAVKELMEE